MSGGRFPASIVDACARAAHEATAAYLQAMDPEGVVLDVSNEGRSSWEGTTESWRTKLRRDTRIVLEDASPAGYAEGYESLPAEARAIFMRTVRSMRTAFYGAGRPALAIVESGPGDDSPAIRMRSAVEPLIDACARALHETLRAFLIVSDHEGLDGLRPWDSVSEGGRKTTIFNARLMLRGDVPRDPQFARLPSDVREAAVALVRSLGPALGKAGVEGPVCGGLGPSGQVASTSEAAASSDRSVDDEVLLALTDQIEKRILEIEAKDRAIDRLNGIVVAKHREALALAERNDQLIAERRHTIGRIGALSGALRRISASVDGTARSRSGKPGARAVDVARLALEADSDGAVAESNGS